VGKRRTANKGRSLAEPKALNLNPPLGFQIDRSASLLLATHLNFPTGTAEVLLETSGRTNTRSRRTLELGEPLFQRPNRLKGPRSAAPPAKFDATLACLADETSSFNDDPPCTSCRLPAKTRTGNFTLTSYRPPQKFRIWQLKDSVCKLPERKKHAAYDLFHLPATCCSLVLQ
jgi:hypothetical protein